VPFDTPLLFKEKSTFHVVLHDVYMHGQGGIEFQGNEVYAYGISADVSLVVLACMLLREVKSLGWTGDQPLST
jgi:hypothetical protein